MAARHVGAQTATATETETDIPLTLSSLRRHYASGTSPQTIIRQVFSTIAGSTTPRFSSHCSMKKTFWRRLKAWANTMRADRSGEFRL